MNPEHIPADIVEAAARGMVAKRYPHCVDNDKPNDYWRGQARAALAAALPMISAAPSAGRVSRKRLREALDRANHAGRAEWQDLYEGNVSPLDLARKAERQAEDALAAALGIEIAEE